MTVLSALLASTEHGNMIECVSTSVKSSVLTLPYGIESLKVRSYHQTSHFRVLECFRLGKHAIMNGRDSNICLEWSFRPSLYNRRTFDELKSHNCSHSASLISRPSSWILILPGFCSVATGL